MHLHTKFRILSRPKRDKPPMHDDPTDLIAAINKAAGRRMTRKRNDCAIVENCCYILNSWGYRPYYDFRQYSRGPFSAELFEDYDSLGTVNIETDVPDETISCLSEIISRGMPYIESYAAVLMAIDNNPEKADEDVLKIAIRISPELEKEITEVSE